jgi:hypothetical protein
VDSETDWSPNPFEKTYLLQREKSGSPKRSKEDAELKKDPNRRKSLEWGDVAVILTDKKGSSPKKKATVLEVNAEEGGKTPPPSKGVGAQFLKLFGRK